MKRLVLEKAKEIIVENNNINDIKLEEIMYGLEGLYLTIYKLIIILIIALILTIFKEVIIFLLLFNVIRFFAFGVHAKNSITCLISSSIIFISLPLISKLLVFNSFIRIIVSALSFVLILRYSPADTEKKPIIAKKRRLFYKVCSVLVCTIFIVSSFIVRNNFLCNSLLLSIFTEALMICPFTYKIFGVSYNNYLAYNVNI